MYYRYMWVSPCMNYQSCCGLHALAILSSHLWQHTAAGSNAFNIYHKISNIRRTKSPNLNVSPLDLQLSLPNPMRPGVEVENEDVVGAAPTGDTSTTSEWSTILLPTKVHLILETWHYICYNFKKGDCFRENNNASEWQVGERKILISHVIYLQVYTSNAQYISFVLVHQIFMLHMIYGLILEAVSQHASPNCKVIYGFLHSQKNYMCPFDLMFYIYLCKTSSVQIGIDILAKMLPKCKLTVCIFLVIPKSWKPTGSFDSHLRPVYLHS